MSASAVAEKPLAAVPEPDDGDDLVIDAGGQISLAVGGRKADKATILFSGGEVALEGQFEKGERVRFEIEGVVSEITFTDLMDRKTGNVTATKRKHVLKLDGARRI